MKVWRWTCGECGGAGIEFTERAAADMLAAHTCPPPPELPQRLRELLAQQS